MFCRLATSRFKIIRKTFVEARPVHSQGVRGIMRLFFLLLCFDLWSLNVRIVAADLDIVTKNLKSRVSSQSYWLKIVYMTKRILKEFINEIASYQFLAS